MSAPPMARARITRDGAQSDARHELAKPIYHQHDEPLTVHLLRAVGRRLDHILDLSTRHGPGGVVGLIALVAVVASAVAVVVWRVGPLRRAAVVGGVLGAVSVKSAAEHRAAAIAAAAREDWGTAVAERMRAIARELEERAILDPRPGRTATEVAADARRELPALADPLARAARTFDSVVYGGSAGTRDEAEQLGRADDAVRGVRRAVRAEAGQP